MGCIYSVVFLTHMFSMKSRCCPNISVAISAQAFSTVSGVVTVAHYLFATMVKACPKKSFSRFSDTERYLAKGWAKQGKKENEIAKLLGRDPGTVNRQLQKPAGFTKKLGRKQVITEALYKKLQRRLITSSRRLRESERSLWRW